MPFPVPVSAAPAAPRSNRPPPAVQLRPVQIEALDALAASVLKGRRRNLTVLPTGGGKTVTFAAAARQLRLKASHRTKKVLVLAHRAELLEQAAATFTRCEPRARVGIYRGTERADWRKVDVLVASVQTIAREATLTSFPPDVFELIHIDEAHHAIADSGYEKVIRHFRGFEPDGPLVCGWTATPNRGDKKALSTIFEAIPYAKHLRDGMAEGWLAPCKYLPVPISGDLLSVRAAGGEFDKNKLAALMNCEDITCTVLGRYFSLRQELMEARGYRPKSMAFAVDRSHAAHIVAALRDMGVDARYIGGDLKRAERKELIEAFARNEYECAVSINLLLEGFDDSEVEVAIDLKPTRSTVLAAQEFGRPIRFHPRKPMAYYIQAVPEHAQEARMVTVPDIFDLAVEWDAEASPGKARMMAAITEGPIHEAGERLESAEQAAATMQALLGGEHEEWSPEERRAHITRAIREAPDEVVELVNVLPDAFRTSDVVWQSRADKSFAVSLGDDGEVTLRPRDLLGHHVVRHVANGREKEIGMAEEIDEARRIAERWIVREHPGGGHLYIKSLAERWSRRAITERQLAYILRLYPDLPPDRAQRLRRGVATKLISFASSNLPMLGGGSAPATAPAASPASAPAAVAA